MQEWQAFLHRMTDAVAGVDDLVAQAKDKPVSDDLLLTLVCVERELRAFQNSLADTWARVSDLADLAICERLDANLIR